MDQKELSMKTLFLVASSRELGCLGNTEWLAVQAAKSLPAYQQKAIQEDAAAMKSAKRFLAR
jgi:hypothetical protein